jgi:hypothetical protein
MGTAGELPTHGRRCQWCRAPVAVLPRSDAAELVLLEPKPGPGGVWQVNLAGTRCRRNARRDGPRYHLHADACPARFHGRSQGLCRGRAHCRAVVTLYGDRAALLCPDCARSLAQWRTSPPQRRSA